MTKANQKQIDASLEALKNDIALAVESAATMRDRVQHALVGCVSHWKTTGSNAGLMDIVNLFITELGQGVNLKAVKQWCEIYLHMQEDVEGKRLVFKPVKVSDLDTKAAADKKWWTLKPQNVFSFDLTDQIIALAVKAAKASKKAATSEDAAVDIDPEMLTQLEALARRAEARKADNADNADPVDTRFTDDDPLAEAPVTA